MDSPPAAIRRANRLAKERSPYLLQHAYNPVDWFPWGDEAFARARDRDVPIFLSIGYSTCHWCHVMERESFESEELAALLNELYVAVKVDREERPDVDRVYMAAVQAMTGGGGWPLSAWLTHELKPFYTGTYFAPDSRYGRPGFGQVLRHLSDTWRNERQRVEAAAEQVTGVVRGLAQVAEPLVGASADIEPALAAIGDRGVEQLARAYEPDHGGFSDAPKFPRPTVLCFLLRHGDARAARMATHTLAEMAAGGIHDLLGGGYHRYSVDGLWRVPHFEKMLYDQAQLVWALVEAHGRDPQGPWAASMLDVLAYVDSRLTHGDGGYFSAEDADSAADPDRPEHKEEGAYYLWERAEIESLLAPRDAEIACLAWGVSRAGNTLHDPHGELGTRNVLYAARSPRAVAAELAIDAAEVEAALERARQTLLAAREQRPRPHLDDKIIVAWNGLMISATARAGAALARPELVRRAQRAARFVLDRCTAGEGVERRLLRRFRGGEAGAPAQLDDHAALVLGLVDLFFADFDPQWLEEALRWTEVMIAEFHDAGDGCFFDSPPGDVHLLARTKEAYDGAEPSGNSLAATALLELGHLLDRPDLRRLAEGVVRRFMPVLERAPHAVPQMLQVLDRLLAAPTDVIVVGSPEREGWQELMAAARQAPYDPHRRLVALPQDDRGLLARVAHLQGLQAPPGGCTATICRGFACELPVGDAEALASRLAARA